VGAICFERAAVFDLRTNEVRARRVTGLSIDWFDSDRFICSDGAVLMIIGASDQTIKHAERSNLSLTL
jgi:hypothetical protein